jgi:hypothetical protein
MSWTFLWETASADRCRLTWPVVVLAGLPSTVQRRPVKPTDPDRIRMLGLCRAAATSVLALTDAAGRVGDDEGARDVDQVWS